MLKDDSGVEKKVSLKVSWDEIFCYAGSVMAGECSESDFRQKIQLVYFHSVPTGFQKYTEFENVTIYDVVFDKIKIQLQALGLITHGTKKRSSADNERYWKLTPFGEKYLIRISAIKSGKTE